MAEDLELDGLESKEVATETKTSTKQEKVVAGVAKLRTLAVSENFSKFLNAAEVWGAGDAEAKDAAKAELVESFGGTDALKDLCSGDELKQEIEELNNVKTAVSAVNTILHFYARRKGAKSSKKVKTQTIQIAEVMYTVSQAYLLEIADKPSAEKKDLLLAHPDTKEVVDMLTL